MLRWMLRKFNIEFEGFLLRFCVIVDTVSGIIIQKWRKRYQKYMKEQQKMVTIEYITTITKYFQIQTNID